MTFVDAKTSGPEGGRQGVRLMSFRRPWMNAREALRRCRSAARALNHPEGEVPIFRPPVRSKTWNGACIGRLFEVTLNRLGSPPKDSAGWGRHSASAGKVSLLLAPGVAPFLVQAQVRWASKETMLRYFGGNPTGRDGFAKSCAWSQMRSEARSLSQGGIDAPAERPQPSARGSWRSPNPHPRRTFSLYREHPSGAVAPCDYGPEVPGLGQCCRRRPCGRRR